MELVINAFFVTLPRKIETVNLVRKGRALTAPSLPIGRNAGLSNGVNGENTLFS
jgi:hypothetical protein